MHILTIVGARPQFIKAAVVSRAIRDCGDMRETIVHTGQHFDKRMSALFFDELDIPAPTVNLGIQGSQHGEMTGRMLQAIEQVLLAHRPDRVLLYGDTNSTLAGALAAAKLQLPIAHVEAGLRSFNRRMPEEINRVLTDHVSDLLFAPTPGATRNLAREGLDGKRIHLVGDVMQDAAKRYKQMALERSDVLDRIGLDHQAYVLSTIHRAENTGNVIRLSNIIEALKAMAREIPVVLPLHPRTGQALKQADIVLEGHPGLHVIEPVGYLDMVRLECSAALIATDSGGVQKEAYFHRVPCVTFRDETEWNELLASGWNRLAPPHDASFLLDAMRVAMGSQGAEAGLYGDGDAGERIAQSLREGAAS